MDTQSIQTVEENSSTGIIPLPASESGTLMPAITIEQALERYRAIITFTKAAMRQGVDYGTIPGTEKPTLLKPGAEKLLTLFGLSASFDLVGSVEDWEHGLFYYRYRCTLTRRDGTLAGNGEGSVNSKEKKYRWRYVQEKKASDEDRKLAVRVEDKTGQYGRYRVYVLENDDIYSQINTLQKMAQKRAMIAAVLVAVNASEFFTQDLEDYGLYGDFEQGAPTSAAPLQHIGAYGNGGGQRMLNGQYQPVVDAPVTHAPKISEAQESRIRHWSKQSKANKDAILTYLQQAQITRLVEMGESQAAEMIEVLQIPPF